MPFSIKKQLLCGLLSAFTLTICISLAINYYHTQQEIQDLFDAQLAQAAKMLLEISEQESPGQLVYQNPQDIQVPHHINTEIYKYQQAIDYLIWTGKDRLALRSENMPDKPLATIDNTFQDMPIRAENWRVYSVTNIEKDIHVQVAQRYDARNNMSGNISSWLLTSFGIMLPLLTLITLYMVGRTLAPLSQITAQMENRKFNNLQPVSLHDVPIEVKPLISLLNTLFSRLKSAILNISQLTSHTAHVSRTRIAQQKVHSQRALNTIDYNNRGETLKGVMYGLDRTTALVEQLLTLSKLNPTDHLAKSDRADLFIICEEKLAALAPQALEKDIELSYEADNYLFVHSKPDVLARLVGDLIENAIRYTLAGGVVAVKAYRQSTNIIFSISDSGPGISQQKKGNGFNQFQDGTISNATSDTTSKQTGVGLGLSLLKPIAQSLPQPPDVPRVIDIQGAKIQLRDSEFNGLKIEVRFHLHAKEWALTDDSEEQLVKAI